MFPEKSDYGGLVIFMFLAGISLLYLLGIVMHWHIPDPAKLVAYLFDPLAKWLYNDTYK